MKSVLKKISAIAIELNELPFTHEQISTNWLGNSPACLEEIEQAEQRLGVKFPEDYRNFLLTTNGFYKPINATEPTFEKIEKVDYLKTVDNFTIECYSDPSITITKDLERAIVIAGINDEEYFLLVPPNPHYTEWKYLKFANWLGGELQFTNLLEYFNSVLTFISK